VTIVAEREIDDVSVAGIDSQYIWEREVDGAGRKGRGRSRSIAGRVNNVALFIDGSDIGPGVPWDELVTIAALQATKIRERGASVLTPESGPGSPTSF